MFWVLAVWVGVVVVGSMVISAMLTGHAFPGIWGRSGRAAERTQLAAAPQRAALAGRLP